MALASQGDERVARDDRYAAVLRVMCNHRSHPAAESKAKSRVYDNLGQRGNTDNTRALLTLDAVVGIPPKGVIACSQRLFESHTSSSGVGGLCRRQATSRKVPGGYWSKSGPSPG